MKLRLAKLEGMRVWHEDGRLLGRVFELRMRARSPQIESLLCGRRGLLERLGWKQQSGFAIPWRQVRRIGRRGITVRAVDEEPR
jgi:sporulation protein YlmC with PRC-barrel domain